jgi:prepilin-type N-terminal cleavage/methylation domain-containing protein
LLWNHKSYKLQRGFTLIELLLVLLLAGVLAVLGWWLSRYLFYSKPQPQKQQTKKADLRVAKEIGTLRVLSIHNTAQALQLRIRLVLLHRQGQRLPLKLALRLKREGGGYALIDEFYAGALMPLFKLHAYDDHMVSIPYKDISVAPGSHPLFFDLKLFSDTGQIIAAVLNKDFVLVVPAPAETLSRSVSAVQPASKPTSTVVQHPVVAPMRRANSWKLPPNQAAQHPSFRPK